MPNLNNLSSSYAPDWRSLRRISVPQWLQDAKFGIYTHWGVYSLNGRFGCWFPNWMYQPGSDSQKHFEQTFGKLKPNFGYKDLIPKFTAERFDPEEWAELFAQSGAKFAGPVGEHHDGFCMWGSKHTPWNAQNMGPKRDIVQELERAYRAKGLKFLVALHHAENWFFYPHWLNQYDTSNPDLELLYGPPHDLDSGWTENWNWDGFRKQTQPSEAFLKLWLDKTKEVIDRFHPDMLWFDFGLGYVREREIREMAAYYYAQAERNSQDVLINFKNNDMVVGSGIYDYELGGAGSLQQKEWITDTTIERGPNICWSWAEGLIYKSPEEIIQKLVDNVSKNGYFLLNVGPHPDGSIPPEAQSVLRGVGRWLETYGEAIYGTSPWRFASEGPTNPKSGNMTDAGEYLPPSFTPKDIRYTAKGSTLYAFCYAWAPEWNLTLLRDLFPGEVTSVTLLGEPSVPLNFQQTRQSLDVQAPEPRPCPFYVLKIARESTLR